MSKKSARKPNGKVIPFVPEPPPPPDPLWMGRVVIERGQQPLAARITYECPYRAKSERDVNFSLGADVQAILGEKAGTWRLVSVAAELIPVVPQGPAGAESKS